MQALISTMERGLIKVGEELPPERDLAAGLGVSRNSLRECLAILEYMGIIETQGNRKIVVKDASYFQKQSPLSAYPAVLTFFRIRWNFAEQSAAPQ